MISNRKLLIENNADIYLFKGYLIVTTKCIENMSLSVRDVVNSLGRQDMLLIDIDKPQITVHKFAVNDISHKCIVLSGHITRCVMMDIEQHIEHIKYPITMLPSPLRKSYDSVLEKLTIKPKKNQPKKEQPKKEQPKQEQPKQSKSKALSLTDTKEAHQEPEPFGDIFTPSNNISVLGDIKPDSNITKFIKWINESWSSECSFMRYADGLICLDFNMARKEFRSQTRISIRVKEIDCLRHDSVQLVSKTDPNTKVEYWILKRGVMKL